MNIASERRLIATDEGTHNGPRKQRVYRTANGVRVLVVRHGDALISERSIDIKMKITDLPTDGRWRFMVEK